MTNRVVTRGGGLSLAIVDSRRGRLPNQMQAQRDDGTALILLGTFEMDITSADECDGPADDQGASGSAVTADATSP
jgi:hypothetical protein